MVRVEMGEEYMVYVQIINPRLDQLPCSAASAVEEKFLPGKLERITG